MNVIEILDSWTMISSRTVLIEWSVFQPTETPLSKSVHFSEDPFKHTIKKVSVFLIGCYPDVCICWFQWWLTCSSVAYMTYIYDDLHIHIPDRLLQSFALDFFPSRHANILSIYVLGIMGILPKIRALWFKFIIPWEFYES